MQMTAREMLLTQVLMCYVEYNLILHHSLFVRLQSAVSGFCRRVVAGSLYWSFSNLHVHVNIAVWLIFLIINDLNCS